MSEIKVMNNDEIRDFCIKKDLKIFELQQEIERLHSIIKEVREYIEALNEYGIGKTAKKELLEILDKENK